VSCGDSHGTVIGYASIGAGTSLPTSQALLAVCLILVSCLTYSEDGGDMLLRKIGFHWARRLYIPEDKTPHYLKSNAQNNLRNLKRKDSFGGTYCLYLQM
jgi:hypothetical protein